MFKVAVKPRRIIPNAQPLVLAKSRILSMRIRTCSHRNKRGQRAKTAAVSISATGSFAKSATGDPARDARASLTTAQ
jgi:hypothetical protein